MPTRQRQSGASSATTRTELPQYEPPAFPLNPAAQRALAQITHVRNLKKLRDSLSEAAAGLTNAAGDINERLTEKERDIKKRRTGPSSQDTRDENAGSAEEGLEELRDKVERMTRRMDEGMRKIIDGQYSIEYMNENLNKTAEQVRNNASTQASTQRGRSQRQAAVRNEDSEHEEDEEYQDFDPTDPDAVNPTGNATTGAPINHFRTLMEDSRTRYQSHTLTARYANNNDYRNFRKMVHQARHIDDDTPMQHHDEWFDEGQAPAPGVTTRARAGADAEDDDDDDIAVSRATISTKCPLTLQEFRNPLTSRSCPHSFEADAIHEVIGRNVVGGRPGRGGTIVGGRPGVQCPVPGCSQEITRDELYEDVVLIRKIRRLQRAKQLEAEEAEDDDGRPSGTQNRAQLIDDDDEDGADVDDLLEEDDHVPATQMKVEKIKASRTPVPSAPRSTDVVDLGSSQSATEAEEDEGEDGTDEDE